MTQQAEDDFRRPQTVAKRDNNGNPLGGNGTSPTNAPWIDEFSQPQANGAAIASDGDSVRLAQGRVLIYGEESKGVTQYAELFVYKATDDPGAAGNYNFDLEARLAFSGSTSKAYAIKLTKGHVGSPANRQKHSLYVLDTSLLNALNGGGTPSGGEIMDVETECGGGPPIASTGASNAVWMRIVVENVSGVANVTGWVAWGCSLGSGGQPQDISLCSHKCSRTWSDTDNNLSLLNTRGQWSFTAHEHTYQIGLFRAGGVPGS